MGQHSKHLHCLTGLDDPPFCDPTDKGEGSQQKLWFQGLYCQALLRASLAHKDLTLDNYDLDE